MKVVFNLSYSWVLGCKMMKRSAHNAVNLIYKLTHEVRVAFPSGLIQRNTPQIKV